MTLTEIVTPDSGSVKPKYSSQRRLGWLPHDLADEPGNQIAWESAADFVHELDSDVVGDAESRGAAHGIEGMEVVGKDAGAPQGERQRFELVGVVVHVLEQDGLVHESRAAAAEPRHRVREGLVDLGGMVDVHDHHDAQACGVQDGAEVGRDARGDRDGQTGVDAEGLDVRDRFDPRDPAGDDESVLVRGSPPERIASRIRVSSARSSKIASQSVSEWGVSS